ncbi:DUF6397 family protein [Streptomyces sp. NK08204]|uniref:DUF6397 family protein n=1 Tax=Streptomyces sp. NK08204 TaxID=2873260 RepID=UPI001CED6E3B|nr:DUF6397 family protein [Streptomyces sp. NK08204]
MSASTFDPTRPASYAAGRAARELALKRSEFDLAVLLGQIRTVPDDGGGGDRRVERAEIDRLRTQDGFPGTLRERVRIVGTAEGAALMEIPAGRFTRLARVGLLVPVKFYLSRYRAVVWLYLAEELRQFASDTDNAPMLKGRTPEAVRGQLETGVDLRARNWRSRHRGFLLRQAEDAWQRAGALASFLELTEVADVVKDPCERAQLNHFRTTPPAHGMPGPPSALLAEQIMTAADPDEIAWLRSELAEAVREARLRRPAPRPAVPYDAPAPQHPAPRHGRPGPRPAPRHVEPLSRPAPRPAPRHHEPEPGAPRRHRGLRSWLRRRRLGPAQI